MIIIFNMQPSPYFSIRLCSALYGRVFFCLHFPDGSNLYFLKLQLHSGLGFPATMPQMPGRLRTKSANNSAFWKLYTANFRGTFSHFPSAPDWLLQLQLVDVIFKFPIKTFLVATFADATTQENAKKGFYSPVIQFTFRLKQSTNFLTSYVSIILSLSFPYFKA